MKTSAKWEGATWAFQGTIANGAGGAGDQTYAVTPGEGNELEVLYGEVLNGDTVARNVSVQVDDGTNIFAFVPWNGLSLGAGSRQGFPQAITGTSANLLGAVPTRLIVSGSMRLLVTVAAVAASQDSALGLVARLRGPTLPTVTLAGASTPTLTTNVNRVF